MVGVFCLLALAAYMAMVATGEVRDRGCPWDQDCATPASIEEDSNE